MWIIILMKHVHGQCYICKNSWNTFVKRSFEKIFLSQVRIWFRDIYHSSKNDFSEFRGSLKGNRTLEPVDFDEAQHFTME